MQCFTQKWVYPDSHPQGLEVPCGKCLVCLSNKRNDWAFRLEQEHKRSKGSAFITLTYSPQFLPKNGASKRHLQLFFKRLRKKFKFRYFAVAEYGTKTDRIHYHILLFNFDGTDRDIQNAWSYKSKITGKSTPIGIVHCGKVNQASIMYCTKYVIQRSTIPHGERNAPFVLCSRSYGLGAGYLTDEMVNWHRSGKRNYAMRYNVQVRLPRYYKEKIWYRTWDKKKTRLYIHKDREAVSLLSIHQSEAAKLANIKAIREAGYKDPDKIIAEMRRAVVSRITEKIAYTQTL